MNRYNLLGPLDIEVDGRPIGVRSRRQRTALALLLVNHGHLTLTEQLLYALWGDNPPDTAVGQVQTVIWRLRGHLGEAAIDTHPGGYVLPTANAVVDAALFSQAVAHANVLAGQGSTERASAELAKALALWRGDPLADVAFPGDPVASGFKAAVAELIEKRVAAERAYIDLEFSLGRHAPLVPMLHQLWQRDPMREELAERFMIALHRSGRRGEALEVFRRSREAIVDELGLEPGPALNATNSRVLAGDGDQEEIPAKSPRQLPMDLPTFVARDELAAKLASLLTTCNSGSPTMIAISGAAGCGKTALAVRVAHLASDRFPNGQLFFDMRGAGEPVDPAEVLAQFLRALGQDARAIPNATNERAAMFRDQTSGRRLLVVLDNVNGEAQVRPLLPASPTCAVLVTSRPRIAAHIGAHEVDLGLFEPHEALDLLRITLGPARVGGKEDVCLEVAKRCGYLPLAIKVAAARLADRPHWTIQKLADQLAGARLSVLSTRDSGVRASLDLSAQTLAPGARALFASLGAIEPMRLPGWTGAALLGVTAEVAEEQMEELVDARLVEATTSSGYRMHDLVWEYARELLTPPAAPVDLAHWYGAWLALADAAYEHMPGGFQRVAPMRATRWSCWSEPRLAQWFADPVPWCEDHRATVVDVVRQASDSFPEVAWNLAVTMTRFFETREHLDDWRVTHEVALRACAATGDLVGEAYLARGLGELSLNLDQYGQALRHLDRALSKMEECGDRRGTVAVLRAAATAHRMLGQHDQAMTGLTRAHSMCADEADAVVEAQILHNMGAVYRITGQLDQAEAAYEKALALFHQLGDRFGQSFVLCSLGLVAGNRPDRVDEAERRFRESLEMSREFGYRRGEAIALGNLGDLYQRHGMFTRAIPELIAAIALCREIHDTRGEMIEMRRLGEVYLLSDRASAARSVLERSLAIATDLELPDDQQEIRSLLGRV